MSYNKFYLEHREEQIAKAKHWQKINAEQYRATQAAYQARPEIKQKIKERREKYSSTWRLLIDEILLFYGCQNIECPCRARGFVPAELDFHHLRDKKFIVAGARCRKKSVVATEVNKCVVLCSNCHRRHHAGLLEVNESMLCHVDDELKMIVA